MTANAGSFDRAARETVGIMAGALGFSGAVGGTPGVVLVVAGAALLATGITGWCPLYRALGWSTVRHDPPTRGLTSP